MTNAITCNIRLSAAFITKFSFFLVSIIVVIIIWIIIIISMRKFEIGCQITWMFTHSKMLIFKNLRYEYMHIPCICFFKPHVQRLCGWMWKSFSWQVFFCFFYSIKWVFLPGLLISQETHSIPIPGSRREIQSSNVKWFCNAAED